MLLLTLFNHTTTAFFLFFSTHPPVSGKRTPIWRYHLDRWSATQTWPCCPLARPPPLSAPTAPPSTEIGSGLLESPQMNMHAQQPPLITPLQQALQMSDTHWAVCEDYSLNVANKTRKGKITFVQELISFNAHGVYFIHLICIKSQT